jgi:hypothetical protein
MSLKRLYSTLTISRTDAYQSILRKESQYDYYKRNHSSPIILNLVALNGHLFGHTMERIMRSLYNMDPRTSTQHDGIFSGHKIEIKCARYWNGTTNCRWQHLQLNHDYDIAMLVLVDFHKVNVWAIHKSLLMGTLLKNGIVTKQGNQGYWTSKSDIISYLSTIETMQDLTSFIKK